MFLCYIELRNTCVTVLQKSYISLSCMSVCRGGTITDNIEQPRQQNNTVQFHFCRKKCWGLSLLLYHRLVNGWNGQVVLRTIDQNLYLVKKQKCFDVSSVLLVVMSVMKKMIANALITSPLASGVIFPRLETINVDNVFFSITTST